MRSRYLLCMIMVLCFITVLSVTSCYQCYGGGVTGAVREDVDGDGYEVSEPPISGPSMRLLIGTTPYLGPINRTSGGGYSFLAPPGNYNVEASASGYVTQTKPVTIPSSGNVTKNFGLKRSTSSPSFQEGVSKHDGGEAFLENDNVSTSELHENAIQILQDVKNQVLLLDPTVFKTPDRQNMLVKKYDTVIRNIQESRYDLALRKL